MKTEWDYTNLADAYLKRPDYAAGAIDAMVRIAGLPTGGKACDVGAGVGHLTLMLLRRGLEVTAVEPNDAMRRNGSARSAGLQNIRWVVGTGEESGQPAEAFDLVTFGSSFNVTDRSAALRETARILKRGGWFACMWNHRRLDDPIQRTIEETIKNSLPGYEYGKRREDQTAVIRGSGLFGDVVHLDAEVLHRQSVEDCIEAWRSHATLARQAKERFGAIVDRIQDYLKSLKVSSIDVPYVTNIWMARRA